MESSEDDAGNATSASRRVSAREKDVGQAEDVDATSCYHHEPYEARQTCGTPAMSEDNFDGDSVPSPSAQDVNTSTEAILDMIDEIVDGPGAPKRIPLSLQICESSSEASVTVSDLLEHKQDSTKLDNIDIPLLSEVPLAGNTIKEDVCDATGIEVRAECSTGSTISTEAKTTECAVSSIPSTIQLEIDKPGSVILEPTCPESEPSTSCSVSSIPSCNITQNIENSSEISDSEKLDRTVKCVSSSDNRDNVTVESAESTSTVCSVSELKTISVEPTTRSPLKRRLVRPAPSDRRPDSTVSSTADSQSIDVEKTKSISSESIVKDVSSSSDAIPTPQASAKPEEIRNVSDISVCQAETSVSPRKRLKLIRQKILPAVCKNDVIVSKDTPTTSNQCESTISGSSFTKLVENLPETSTCTTSEICVANTKVSIPEPVLHEPTIVTMIKNDECTESISLETPEPTKPDLPLSKHDKINNCKEIEMNIANQLIPTLHILPISEQDLTNFKQTSETQNTVPCLENPKENIVEYSPTVKEESLGNEIMNTNIESSFENSKVNEEQPSGLSKDSNITEPDCTMESKVMQVDNATSSLPECSQEAMKKVPPLKLNLSQLSDASHESVIEKYDDQVSNISSVKNKQDVCNIESNIRPLNEVSDNSDCYQEVEKKVPPIKLNLSQLSDTCLESKSGTSELPSSTNKINFINEESESKQVPKLTIKLNSKSSEDIKSPIPKLTIRPIRPRESECIDKVDNTQKIQNVTKINIKASPKMTDKNDAYLKHVEKEEMKSQTEHIPTITKLNIKPILKPPEKINDIHRKSSSSEISESECSENDESTSTSDQTSASDNGSSVIPKVTIKLGKPGTQSEGKFYTEQNIPKLNKKSLSHPEKEEQESGSTLKVVISQPEDKQVEKIPKLTIKTVARSENQPLSPKLTIKPIKPPDNINKESDIPKLKISTETLASSTDIKENVHVPKITIKPLTKPDVIDTPVKAAKKSVSTDSPEHIPVVTKINIKPILKPTESGESMEVLEDKVPVVSKLNIKPVIKPKDNEIDSSVEDVPKVTKLNIKPLKNPEVNTSEPKDCDEMITDIDKNSMPVITKINIKPIIKPLDEEKLKDSENQSSETGTSSDENADHIPVVTKINIKPILKPVEIEEASRNVMAHEPLIPVLTKLNIKPLVKPDENPSPSSPKKDSMKSPGSNSPTIPVITRLNIKPLVKPDETDVSKSKEDHDEKSTKNPPLVMKINMKAVTDSVINEMCSTAQYSCNSIKDNMYSLQKNETNSGNHGEVGTQRISSEKTGMTNTVDSIKSGITKQHVTSDQAHKQNCVADVLMVDSRTVGSTSGSKKQENLITIPMGSPNVEGSRSKILLDTEHNAATPVFNKSGQQDATLHSEFQGTGNKGPEVLRKSSRATLQYCTLLKKLLENPKEDLGRKSTDSKDLGKNDGMVNENLRSSPSLLADNVKSELLIVSDNKETTSNTGNLEKHSDHMKRRSPSPVKDTSSTSEPNKILVLHDFSKIVNENITKPLEINVSEKVTNISSGQDSPRIILKINKTDHGPSAKIITEDMKKSETIQTDNTQHNINDKLSPKKQQENCRKKGNAELTQTISVRTRLRSSRKTESVEISPSVKQTTGKRPSSTEPNSPQNRENEMSVLDAKRLKLGQILSNNAMQISPNVSITPIVSKGTQASPTKPNLEIRQGGKLINHSILNNDNCSKNGNSKLHNILSNLHAKQMRTVPTNDINRSEKTPSMSSEVDSNASTGSSEVAENVPSETRPIELQEMLISENSDFRDLSVGPEDLSQDPLESEGPKPPDEVANGTETPQPVDTTPQPKKRGRPRKLPVTDSPKSTVTLPVPALEERPQRSLRLNRERPVIAVKPRGGRGRGRGARRGTATRVRTPPAQLERETTPPEGPASLSPASASATHIDPTSSRIKLPRMTEALDKMPSSGSTPVSTGTSELNLFSDRSELKVVLEPTELDDSFMKSPENMGRPKSGRGSRGGRWRTPRGRGRGRGGGRGAMYMKETMGIYGRVCGPATTTVQLFEEETCMMDDNATPAKPSNLMDEDSQSSVKSSTNESSKMKKSKFADLFDSNKVWTAADVKEYTWPPTPRSDMESQMMMVQEQVAMFLGVKSFKRRYPELKRRTIVGEERDYVLAKGLVTEALCDLGITAVDASEVLDIMLSDYPHKYEEYRSHQRERQMAEAVEDTPVETKSEDKPLRIEMKQDKSVEHKPEAPKVDPEKTRQDMAAAAIASASEWNARANALRRPACVDLQSLTVHVRRAPLPRAQEHVRPPAGFYPHALLPGQYQHCYRQYTPEQLRYFPLSTACSAPPPPLAAWECSSSSEGEAEEGSRAGDEDDSDAPAHPTHHNKRKKLTKTKRSSQTEVVKEKEESRGSAPEGEVVDTCRACKLRLEANRKYTHERFLVCANCNAKLHPSCVDLSADTIRKCREYAWQCAECKSCCACRRPADDDKMLFCDLCDRGFHIYCVGLPAVPQGRWHCVECAICKSCGARDPSGLGGNGSSGQTGAASSDMTPAPAEWHHQTKRGPGGHKCYSHSLCTPCARAYRIGRYCPLCERSFIGPKGTMQLVICKLCDRQLHQECVKQTVSSLKVLDYTCAECRRGGITSRAAAVRLAPRTIATLFMAKRRFNKYAHRQYLASRLAPSAADAAEAAEAADATDTSADALPADFGD